MSGIEPVGRGERRVRVAVKAARVRKTLSVCPVCLMRVEASVVRRGDDYYMEKRCGEHGAFSTVVWRGRDPSFEDWGDYVPPLDGYVPDCPTGCGLCPGHRQKTCCALVEVTSRCNLRCPVCYAASGVGGDVGDGGTARADSLQDSSEVPAIIGLAPFLETGARDADCDPDVDSLRLIFKRLADGGNTFVQISGGEPTVRGDLPEIIAAARESGCDTVQLNTNGIRLGTDPEYARVLRNAGLSFVFMQFDGTDDEICRRLRGKPLFDAKCAAIRACGESNLGVTLVPTIVPGVNDHNIGDIIRFAIKHSPDVRGVHFQPVSYFGRYEGKPSNEARITLPEVLRAIVSQTDGKFKISDFTPSACDHPRCGFHGDFVVLPKNAIMRIKQNAPCCSAAPPSVGALRATPSTPLSVGSLRATPSTPPHIKSRNFVARRWTRPAPDDAPATDDTLTPNDTSALDDTPSPAPTQQPTTDIDAFLRRVKNNGFTITAMAFQDAYNLDIERLRLCSLHVAEGAGLIPFCARYITNVGCGAQVVSD